MSFLQWRRGVCFLQLVTALGLGLTTPSASACMPPLPYPGLWYSTLEASSPANGATNVFTDGMIRLSRQAWVASGHETTGPDELRHDVTVVDLETGMEVKGSLRPSVWSEVGTVYWKADSRLLPNRRYALRQTLAQNVSRPQQAQGATQAESTFTTGNRQVPALSVPGRLEASMNTYQAFLCEDGSLSSPCGCPESRREWRHGINVLVPAIEGGLSFGSYRVEVIATQDRPYDFATPASTERLVLERQTLFSGGKPQEGFLQLPVKSSTAIKTCVAWRFFDAFGTVREGSSVCLDAKPQVTGSKPPGTEPIDPPGYLGVGCSLGGAGLGPAALGLLALLRRGRRRGYPASRL